MLGLFCRVLEMSLTGCFCTGVVLLIRLLLIRWGRKYAYYLWIVVFINLLLPFTIHGRFSLILKQVAQFSVEIDTETGQVLLSENLAENNKMEEKGTDTKNVSQSIDLDNEEKDIGQKENGQPSEAVRQSQAENENTQNISGRVLLIVWLLGILGIIFFNMIHIVLFKRQISLDRWTHWDDQERVAEVRNLSAPFLWGIIRPIIFLPTGLEEKEKTFIIMHESCHRRRRDSLFKLVAFSAVTVHWFNPAVWITWMLFCRDMEMSCDEAVLANAGKEIRSKYAQSLLQYAARQNGYLMTPPTFGEPSAKVRIENVLYFRQHGKMSGWAARGIMTLAVFGLTVHPVKIEETPDLTGYINDLVTKNSNVVENVIVNVSDEINVVPTSDSDSKDHQDDTWHREGYVEATIIHIYESLYFTPGLRDEEELYDLAQRALRDLYDLTGVQIESCVYSCSDLGSFYFAKTEEDLIHSRSFYNRSYGEKEGYGSNLIPCMNMANARRYWFSDVQQMDIPPDIEEMEEAELAVWFLQHSNIYQGEEIVDAKPSPDLDTIRIVTADGSFYEVTLDIEIQAVSSIYGPYPQNASH